MMQPRSPHSDAPAAAPAEVSRRKRKLPTHTTAAATTETAGSDSVADPSASKRSTQRRKMDCSSEPKVKDEPRRPEVAEANHPFRGKCLYQSRKCENERALKRNGKAHNLCDEHRSKQNQHQRKFDAKKYTRRKRKGSGEDDNDNEDDDEEDEGSERGEATAQALVFTDKPKRGRTSPAGRSERPVQLPPPQQSSDVQQGVAAYLPRHRPGISPPSYHDARPLDIRRPPALQVTRSAPALSFPPPASRGSGSGLARSPPSVLAFDFDRRSPSYSRSEMLAASILVPPATPVERARPHPSPHGSVAYPFLSHQHPHQVRSRSFDAGVTRISPMGGVAPGSVGTQLPFERQREFFDEHRVVTEQHQRQSPPSALPRPEKLPSLTQLPLGQLARPSPQNSFAAAYPAEGSFHHSPTYGTLPRPPPLASTGQLLPSLGALPRPPAYHSTSSPPQQQYGASSSSSYSAAPPYYHRD